MVETFYKVEPPPMFGLIEHDFTILSQDCQSKLVACLDKKTSRLTEDELQQCKLATNRTNTPKKKYYQMFAVKMRWLAEPLVNKAFMN